MRSRSDTFKSLSVDCTCGLYKFQHFEVLQLGKRVVFCICYSYSPNMKSLSPNPIHRYLLPRSIFDRLITLDLNKNIETLKSLIYKSNFIPLFFPYSYTNCDNVKGQKSTFHSGTNHQYKGKFILMTNFRGWDLRIFLSRVYNMLNYT